MAINYKIDKTKLDKISTRKFDIKTKITDHGRDLDFNSIGSLDRIVGLDKLSQQAEKAILVKKRSYPTSSSLGTSLLNSGGKDTIFLSSDIKNSLAAYSSIQQQQRGSTTTNILGINVYRTVDIKDIDSWTKINEHVIPINSYVDSNVVTNVIYYYAITTVYRDTTNRIKETQISNYKDVIITAYNDLAAKIDSNFIVISESSSNTLYWNLPVELTLEEQIRSILKIQTTNIGNDPRGVRVSVVLTNREVTSEQIVI